MDNTWTEEIINIALKNRGNGKTSKEISELLLKKGYKKSKDAVQKWFERNSKKIEVSLDEVSVTEPKILYFDIETTNLRADFGEVLMMGYKWHNEDDYHLISSIDYKGWEKLPVEKRDKYLLEDIYKIICEAEVLCGHYSKKFDHRFIQTRLLIHGMKPIPDITHVDTFMTAKYQMALQSNKMKNIAIALGCDEQKSEVAKNIWRRANAYDVDAIKQLQSYCIQDVKTQFSMTQKLLPICRSMPNWNLLTGEKQIQCSGCGSRKVKPFGIKHTKVNIFQRYKCSNCGKWMRGRFTLVNKNTERLMY